MTKDVESEGEEEEEEIEEEEKSFTVAKDRFENTSACNPLMDF